MFLLLFTYYYWCSVPVCLTDFLREDTPVGTSFLRAAAHDDDQGSNAAITYSLSNQRPAYLGVNPSTGWVYVNHPISQVRHGLRAPQNLCISFSNVKGKSNTTRLISFIEANPIIHIKIHNINHVTLTLSALLFRKVTVRLQHSATYWLEETLQFDLFTNDIFVSKSQNETGSMLFYTSV